MGTIVRHNGSSVRRALFTLLFAPDTPEHHIDAQMATVDDELAGVRDACQWRIHNQRRET